MKLSIVIPYHNRKSLLLNVLKSFNSNYPIEVVIVDDGSSEEHQLEDILNNYKFKILLIKLEPHTQWRGPIIAYNTGFKAATGDAIMLNSSEVVHIGDIIGYVFNNLNDKTFLNFSAFMGWDGLNEKITNIKGNFETEISGMISGVKSWWGGHSSTGTFIPYSGAITKKNMDVLCGYDTRFLRGVGYEDYDFTERVKNLGLKLTAVDKPFCLHQWHPPTEYPNRINQDLLIYLREHDPNRIVAK
jgi:glycosyltransferase involved in cell wall biosynthesis